MNSEIDLKKLERKAYRSIHQDGIMDIFLGFIMIAMGIYGTLSNLGIENPLGLGILIVLEIVAIFIIIAGKKYITVPRIGIVKPGSERKKKLSKARIVLAISILLGLIFFLVPIVLGNIGKEGQLPWYFLAIIFAMNVFIVFGLVAYFLDYSRLYVIAVLFALTIPFLEILKLFFDSPFNVLIALGLPGIIVIGIGVIYLYRFIKNYPLPKEEEIPNAL
jgi:hypothetical protein